MGYIVAIVGRPNVGKSTFFNRMVERRLAIVDKSSGVTRDRHYATCQWNGKTITLIDTGGYLENHLDKFQTEIDKQVILAIEQSDAIIFMVDIQEGISSADLDVTKLLFKSGKIVYLVANKVDNNQKIQLASEFYKLGFDKIYPISSINGFGTGELLDDLVNRIPNRSKETKMELPHFAIVGRPNAGKSSLLNVLVGTQRSIVTDKSGTTRDSIDTIYKKYNYHFKLIDTAGIRKKSKVKEDIEFYSVMRAIRSIELCDVCLLIIDAKTGFQGQDQNIFWLAHRNNKGIVLLVNKWDLVNKQLSDTKTIEKKIKEIIAPFVDVPILFISCRTKQRVFKVLETTTKVYENRSKKIATSKLNQIMLPVIENSPPPSIKGKLIKIKYCAQLPTKYPQFVFYCNRPQYIKDAYKRFLENQIRNQFDFTGTPIQIIIRKK